MDRTGEAKKTSGAAGRSEEKTKKEAYILTKKITTSTETTHENSAWG